MASHRNEIRNREGESIGQGGASLFPPPARPSSTLNPATPEWVPGSITVADLEATYIKAMTTDPVTGELLPVGSVNGGLLGINRQMVGLASNIKANETSGTTVMSPHQLPNKVNSGAGLPGSRNALGDFHSNVGMNDLGGTTGLSGGCQINSNSAAGSGSANLGGAPLHGAQPRPIGLGIRLPFYHCGNYPVQGSEDGGILGINSQSFPAEQPAATLGGVGTAAGVRFTVQPPVGASRFDNNGGNPGIGQSSGGGNATARGRPNLPPLQNLHPSGRPQSRGGAARSAPQVISNRVLPIPTPIDPRNNHGQQGDLRPGEITASNCFLPSVDAEDIVATGNSPHSVGWNSGGRPNRNAHRNDDPLATPTPVRVVRDPRLGQETPDSLVSTATPRTTLSQHPGIIGQSPAGRENNTMVVYTSPERKKKIHQHGLILMKPMECPPLPDPQLLGFRGQIHVLDLPPLSAAPVDQITLSERSEPLRVLTCGGTGYPPVAMALDPNFFPFEALSEGARRPDYGVVKIQNIPFNTKRCEVIALFGRNAKLLNDVDEPIHIIMDRASSKTNDVYVEFIDMESATRAVERFTHLSEKDKSPRLGDRNVDLQLSSQAALMNDLFPLAKNVVWEGCNPLIKNAAIDKLFDNFRGFVSVEEMFMLVKHVDSPHRSPYSKDCPQRPYECLISTLKKMPWGCTEGITIRQRHAIFDATVNLIRRLMAAVQRPIVDPELNPRLLNRVVQAAMYCPGFSVVQKDAIAYEVKMSEMDTRAYGVPRFAAAWRHLYGVRPKMGIPLDLIEWYAAVIREETIRMRNKVPPAARGQIRMATEEQTDSYFGDLWIELWRPLGENFDMETIADAADRELRCIERVLRRALVH